jgi:hypothetical protein
MACNPSYTSARQDI